LMMPEPAEALRVFSKLRGLGVEISIDDFGTGYSNLRYLERFPLTEIKIDRSFVRDVEHSSAKQVIVETIIKLSKALNIRVVAEGIETEAEFSFMRSLGCSVGQGYLFSRPLDASAFDDFIENHAISSGISQRSNLLT
ncbi:EAL domain-containing protein, partial [Sphingomonas sp. KC8]|uniref:EAL domain-containing protein n=2 Tax=Sphingomonas sp. KC8 TaxID=1030157 RepID=UPI0002489F73